MYINPIQSIQNNTSQEQDDLESAQKEIVFSASHSVSEDLTSVYQAQLDLLLTNRPVNGDLENNGQQNVAGKGYDVAVNGSRELIFMLNQIWQLLQSCDTQMLYGSMLESQSNSKDLVERAGLIPTNIITAEAIYASQELCVEIQAILEKNLLQPKENVHNYMQGLREKLDIDNLALFLKMVNDDYLGHNGMTSLFLQQQLLEWVQLLYLSLMFRPLQYGGPYKSTKPHVKKRKEWWINEEEEDDRDSDKD